jgi:hypothetical protein
MSFYEVLSNYTKVETIISLLAFIVASVLAYLGYTNKAKLKSTERIIKLADTESKADLARSLTDSYPTYKIPDLSQKQGFEVIKMQFAHRAMEFKSKANTLRFSVALLFVAIIVVFARSAYTTYGKNSPVLKGNNNTVNYTDTTHK